MSLIAKEHVLANLPDGFRIKESVPNPLYRKPESVALVGAPNDGLVDHAACGMVPRVAAFQSVVIGETNTETKTEYSQLGVNHADDDWGSLIVTDNRTGRVSSQTMAPMTFAPSKSPSGYVTLRDALPWTEGRAVGWKIAEHAASAKARNWPGITPFEYLGKSIAICGGGPSLAYTLPELRALQREGCLVLAINRTHDYLLNLPKTHGVPWIKPWGGIILEPTPPAAGYMTPTKGVKYFIGSQCAPETFEAFEKNDHVIWHAQSKPELEKILTPEEMRVMVPAVGSTCGLRAILLAYMMGFGHSRGYPNAAIHLFGFDSCYSDHDVRNGIVGLDGHHRLHSYDKPEAIHDMRELMIRGFGLDGKDERKYWGNGNMLAQADEFQRLMAWREERVQLGGMDPHNLVVHGFGAIPDIAREFGMHADRKYERKAA